MREEVKRAKEKKNGGINITARNIENIEKLRKTIGKKLDKLDIYWVANLKKKILEDFVYC